MKLWFSRHVFISAFHSLSGATRLYSSCQKKKLWYFVSFMFRITLWHSKDNFYIFCWSCYQNSISFLWLNIMCVLCFWDKHVCSVVWHSLLVRFHLSWRIILTKTQFLTLSINWPKLSKTYFWKAITGLLGVGGSGQVFGGQLKL